MREAWYGRADTWSAAALDELRAPDAVWRGQEAAGQGSSASLALRMAAIRAGLSELGRQLDQLDTEVERALSRHDAGAV